MLKATKVRIYSTPEQANFLNRQFSAVRFGYNKALHIISSQYKLHDTKLKAKLDVEQIIGLDIGLTHLVIDSNDTNAARYQGTRYFEIKGRRTVGLCQWRQRQTGRVLAAAYEARSLTLQGREQSRRGPT